MAIIEANYLGIGTSTVNGRPHSINHLNLTAEWADAIYQIENGDKAVGGENGLANLQAQQLGNRTEFLLAALNNIYAYLYQYTPDGATKVRVVSSPDRPDDTSKLWVKISGETEIDNNPEVMVTLDSGEVFNLFDGKTIFTVNGMKYALVGENDEDNYKPTLPSGDDTVPTDTIPADDTTSGGDDTVPSDTVPSGNDDATLWAGQEDFDTLLSDLWGDDNG